jgi:hypothetical protein
LFCCSTCFFNVVFELPSLRNTPKRDKKIEERLTLDFWSFFGHIFDMGVPGTGGHASPVASEGESAENQLRELGYNSKPKRSRLYKNI